MMALLGQHGQPLDYQRGIEMIRFSAETADENAPQGAFVSIIPSLPAGPNEQS